MSQASSPSSLAAEESPRESLSGHGRDWRYYAGACGVAGALTASVRLWTRRTHLPLSVPEPPMVYSRRMASRAFLYATCINIFAGIGIVAAAAFYCEIDNVRSEVSRECHLCVSYLPFPYRLPFHSDFCVPDSFVSVPFS